MAEWSFGAAFAVDNREREREAVGLKHMLILPDLGSNGE